MPNPLNVPITPPRVAFLDPRTGNVSREWYMFFLSLFQTQGGSTVSLDDVQKGPPSLTVDEINNIVSKVGENLHPSTESTVEQIAELQKQIEALAVQARPELGTMSQLQQDNVPWLQFDTTAEGVPPNIGTVAWDGGTTLGIQMTANVLQPVGEAQYFYIKADSTITKGQLIMFTGAVGASGVIRGAPATGLTDGQYLMGIAAEDIATNGFGLVTSFGHVRGWNTTGSPVGETWADGDILYYNPSVAGGLTKTQPTAPNVKATVAVVVNAAPAGSGDVFVRVSTGSVLGGTDSNVQFGTLTNGDLIQYDSALGYWKNVPASTLPVGTATNLAGGAAGSVPYQTGPSTTTFRSIGTAGQVFRVNSGATAPEWVSGSALTKTDDTNVTLTLGGTPATALLAATSLTLGWTGQLAVSRGGTGLSSFTSGGILYASGTGTLATGTGLTTDGVNVSQIGTSPLLTLQDNASANNSRLLLQAQSGAVYISTTYSSSNIPMIFSVGGTSTGAEVFRITTAGKLNVTGLTASKVVFTDASKDLTSTGTVSADQGGTGQSSYTTGDLLYATGATALSKLGIGASGRWLGSSGTAPQWNAPAALTETDDTNVTLTLGGNPNTALLNSVSMTLGWTGQLAVGRGGTGTGTAFTTGSVVFAGASGVYSQNNANFFWDNTNARLGIGNAAPATRLHVTQPNDTAPGIRVTNSTSRSAEIGYTGAFEFSVGPTVTNDNTRFGVFVAGGGVTTLWTNNLERVRVFSGGGVSIGNTTDPGATNLSVTGTGRFGTTVGVGNAAPAASGAGITFPAVASDSSDANTLDDYEEGTWTPTVSSASGTTTKTGGSGTYIKIGKFVYINWSLTMNTNASVGTSDLSIGGLPFTPASSYQMAWLANSNWTAGDLANGANGVVQIGSSTTILYQVRTANISSRTGFTWTFSGMYTI